MEMIRASAISDEARVKHRIQQRGFTAYLKVEIPLAASLDLMHSSGAR